MLVDAASPTAPLRIEADVCIVGSGPAGISLANELRANFANVVVLEGGQDDYDESSQSLYTAEKFPTHFPDPMHSRLRFLGGTSNHWANSTMPLSPIDFEKRDWVPNSGWPITYADVSKYYDKAGQYCGVDADGYDLAHWRAKTGIVSPLDQASFLVTRVAKSARPPTRFYAKHGAALHQSGRVSVYKNANVTDLLFDPVKRRVREVTFTANGQRQHRVSAGVFVLCMGGLENARMLLVFNEKYGNQLGNQGDSVGRYFMEHPTVKPAAVMGSNEAVGAGLSVDLESKNVAFVHEYSEKVLREQRIVNGKLVFFNASQYDLSDGISSFHILKERLIKGQLPDEAFLHLSNLIRDFDMVAEAISRKSFDKNIFAHADQLGGAGVHIMMEQTPDRNNRIRLGSQRDRLGVKKLVVDWTLSNQDIEMMWSGLMLLGREIGALSLGRLRLLKEQSQRLFGDQMSFGLHHMGTTRMATSPASGVTDADQRVFGTDNLYVAGSSVFATGGHVAPTLSIVALSLRLADHLKARGLS